jgi:hypothetical protein
VIVELIRQGHTVTGMSRSEAGLQNLVALGATIAVVNAFDESAVEQVLRRAEAEMVIDQLTALPRDPSQFAAAFPVTGPSKTAETSMPSGGLDCELFAELFSECPLQWVSRPSPPAERSSTTTRRTLWRSG